jgi:hypothetical protein
LRGKCQCFRQKGGELPLGLLPFHGRQIDRGLENFGGIVTRESTLRSNWVEPV